MTNAIRILGLDPGLRRTGWGVISVEGSRLVHIAHGVIAPKENGASACAVAALKANASTAAALRARATGMSLISLSLASVESVFIGGACAPWRKNPARTVGKPGAACARIATDCKKRGQTAQTGEWRAHSGACRTH